MTMPQIYIGVDIAKLWIDVFDPRDKSSHRYENTPIALKRWIKKLGTTQIIFEATSGCDGELIDQLVAADIAYTRVNPKHARDFAGATGRLAKTDKVDARMLAHMGQALLLAPSPSPQPHKERLATLIARRSDLVLMLTAEKNRLQTVRDRWVHKEISASIRSLIKRQERVEAEIERHKQEHSDLVVLDKRLQTAPGIGPRIAEVLMARLPELGSLDRRSIGHLAGLAPHASESGRRAGRRMIKGGRKDVRKAMYIAALVAVQWDDHWKAVYQTMRAKGKPGKVALIAVARRLLIRLNAMVAKQLDYNG